MTNPLLSICIPTYNRANYLAESLAAIVVQFQNHPELLTEVEVIISDNASTDTTALVAQKYRAEYPNITYFCNDKNLGSDENYISAVGHSNGEYGWLIGDDDYIVGGGIKFVVDYLRHNQVSVLTVESRTFVSVAEVLTSRLTVTPELLVRTNSHDNFFKQGYCIGLLCSIIFRRSLWLAVDRANYRPGWSYYEIALKLMAQSSLPMVHLSCPLVITREDSLWVKDGTEFFFFINWKKILEKLADFGYNRTYLQSRVDELAKHLLIILLRAKGHDLRCSIANYKLLSAEFKSYPGWLLLATVIYPMPNNLVKAVRDLKKYLKHS